MRRPTSVDLAGARRSARLTERSQEPTAPARLLIAGEQPLFLDGLQALLGREPDTAVVARCASDEDVVGQAQALQPDVALLDVDISRPTNLAIVRRFNEVASATKVVVLTPRTEEDALVAAVRLGVRGVLLKSVASATILQCIRQVHGGGYWLDKQMTAKALRKIVRREVTQRQLSVAGLTPRELEIAKLAGQGLRNLAIGTTLSISPATVKIHLHQIYRKLNLSGRLALMIYARDNDLI
jgi:two-component system, NarL family, nitrate/nitrite response regulator NarL